MPSSSLPRKRLPFRYLLSSLKGGGVAANSGRKVFCIGRNKTGTTSVETALRAFGYRLAPQGVAELMLRDWAGGDYDRIIRLCRNFEAFQDIPFSLPDLFKRLDEEFPDAKFILTVRDSPEQWYQSLTRFHQKLLCTDGIPTANDLKRAGYRYPGFLWECQSLIYGLDEESVYHREKSIRHYLDHNQSVREYFRDRPDRLIELNVSDPDAYPRLAAFLDQKVEPDAVFPWDNRT